MEFANCRYDGKLGCYVPDSTISIKDFKSFISKKDATNYARSVGIPLNRIARLGTRFCKVWGFRRDFQTDFFLKS